MAGATGAIVATGATATTGATAATGATGVADGAGGMPVRPVPRPRRSSRTIAPLRIRLRTVQTGTKKKI